MSHLNDINAILKQHGLGFVKIQTKAIHGTKEVTFKNWQDETFKGIRGGSIGPMTLTNAHLEKNKTIQHDIEQALTPLVNEIARQENGFCIVFETKPGKFRHIDFTWTTFQTYLPSADLDSRYKTYWLIANTKDC